MSVAATRLVSTTSEASALLEAVSDLRRLSRPSGLPPMERSWLRLDTFTRADEWGHNLEALGIPAFGLSVLTLAQDFASGATEVLRPDCILIQREDTTKILPLVSAWTDYERVVRREAGRLPHGSMLGYVPDDGRMEGVEAVEAHREFVYHRESAAAMLGSSLSSTRRQVRQLLKAGARIEAIAPANLDRVIACNARWFAGKHERGRKTYYRGRTLWTFENLPLLAELGVRHLAVLIDDDVIGYTVGSHVAPSCAVFTFRRGDREPAGVSAYMLSELAKLYPEYAWINDGPAVNKPGLAEFKERFTANAGDKQVSVGWIRARRSR
jgi:hypothetical protein